MTLLGAFTYYLRKQEGGGDANANVNDYLITYLVHKILGINTEQVRNRTQNQKQNRTSANKEGGFWSSCNKVTIEFPHEKVFVIEKSKDSSKVSVSVQSQRDSSS